MRETLVKSEEFKDSALEKIPQDWNYLTINDCLQDGLIVDVQDGNHGEAHPKTDDFVSEGIPFVMAKDLVNGQINLADCHKITWHQYQSLRVGFGRPGDVLLSHKGTIGLTAIVPNWLQHVMLTPQVTYYRVCEGKKLSGKFLFWFFQSPLFQQRLEVLSAQSTRSYIGITLQKTLSIVVPPFDEQKRIAELLDTVDEAIAHTSSLIAKLKQMKAGLLHDLLTRGLDENGELRDAIAYPEQFKDSPLGRIPKDWEVLNLESLLNGRPKNGYSPKEVNEWTGTLMLGLGCLTEEGFEPLQLKNAPSNDLKIQAALLNDGDFLLSRSNTRERVALAGIYRHVGVPCIYSDLMMRLSINEKTCNRFLELLLRHFPIKRQLTGNAQGTSISMVKISSQTVIETVVALPNPTEQARIIECVDTYDTRIRAEEAYRDKLKLQKQGLMHDLLTGKVRVKNA